MTAREPETGAIRSRLPWQLAFVVLASIWGCSFYFIKLGLIGLNPIQVAFARLSIGAITLVILVTLTRTRLPRNRSTWRHLFVMAVLMNVFPFVLFSYGETQVSSILAGIINGVTVEGYRRPLWTAAQFSECVRLKAVGRAAP